MPDLPPPPVPHPEALLRRAIELQLIEVVGPAALKAYFAGRRVQAHNLLRLRLDAVPARAKVGAVLLEDETLWVDPAPEPDVAERLIDDGVGERFGLPVRTRVNRILGIRGGPLANYLVDPTDLQRPLREIPILPHQRKRALGRSVATFLALIILFAVPAAIYAPHTVVVYNAFPAPIQVQINGEAHTVAPFGVKRRWVSGGSVQLEARDARGAPFDQREATLTRDTLLYTPGEQAVLAQEVVSYGDDRAPEAALLPVGAVQTVSADDLLVDPPASLQLRRGSVIHRTHIFDLFHSGQTWAMGLQVGLRARALGEEDAIELALLSLRVAPLQPELLTVLEPRLGAADRRAHWSKMAAELPRPAVIQRWAELGERPSATSPLPTASLENFNALIAFLHLSPDPVVVERICGGLLDEDEAKPKAGRMPDERRIALRTARAEALGRLSRFEASAEEWRQVERLAHGSGAFFEAARARRLGGLPPLELSPNNPDQEAQLLGLLLAAEAGSAVTFNQDAFDDALMPPFLIALARSDASGARRLANELGAKSRTIPSGIRPLTHWASTPTEPSPLQPENFLIELSPAGDPARRPRLLAAPRWLPPGWTRVAAAAAADLGLPSAAAWAQASRDNPDAGPSLEQIIEASKNQPAADTWRAFAPSHWPLASLAASYLAPTEAQRDAWLDLARASALPGELLWPNISPEQP